MSGSTGARSLHTKLNAVQEIIALSLRQSLYLPLDDLVYISWRYMNSDVSRLGIARLLKRECIARLENVIPKAEGDTILIKKTFKDYAPLNMRAVDRPILPVPTMPVTPFMAQPRKPSSEQLPSRMRA